MRKLGLHHRGELMRFALEHGLSPALDDTHDDRADDVTRTDGGAAAIRA